MSSKLFGTDGIRGPAGSYPLDPATTEQIGRAIGVHFAEQGQIVLIACDPRESSQMLVEAVVKGLLSVGVNVINIGLIPTPGLSYLTKVTDAVAGVMITASHNLYQDNGIKIFASDGGKLDDDVQDKLNILIDSEIPLRGKGGESDGHLMIDRYLKFLLSTSTSKIDKLNIAIDCANGATSGTAVRVFEELGARVHPLFNRPDGRNINVQCGATDPAFLQKYVIDNNLDAGIAFDGDGDRVLMVDSKGRILDGDHLLYILALNSNAKGVVATIMSNMALQTTLQANDIELKRVDVGDRYVLEGLEQTGWKLGGEQSGHIIIKNLAGTGDGTLAALQILNIVKSTGKDLATWRDELKLLPQALINIDLPDRKLLLSPALTKITESTEAQIGANGRVNIRASGTEPKLRIMVEADNAQSIAEDLRKQILRLIGDNIASDMPKIEFGETYEPLIQYLTYGDSDKLQKQLIAKSQQPAILKYTPKDATSRFKDKSSLNNWLKKGREIFWLIGQNDDLAGIVWYGKSKYPLGTSQPGEPDETFAIRIYEGYSGHGLAVPFMKLSLKTLMELRQNTGFETNGLWLQTDIDNPAAVAVYTKFGYQEVARDDKRITMVLTKDKIREITST